MLAIQSAFNKSHNKADVIPHKALDISNIRVPHAYQDVDSFKAEFIKHYGHTALIDEIKSYPNIDFANEFGPRICFQRKETRATRERLHGKPKINTYILCSVCDPFSNTHLGPNFKTYIRDGVDEQVDINQPQFYDTLHSQYEHHMSHAHGIFKGGRLAAQPFVGFTMTQKTAHQAPATCSLSCICPYSKANSSSPCLAEIPFHHKKENPYKAYVRHVHAFHHNISNAEHKECTYQPQVVDAKGGVHPNTFIPLSMEHLNISLSHLQMSCGTSRVNPIIISQDNNELQRVANCVLEPARTQSRIVTVQNILPTPRASPEPASKKRARNISCAPVQRKRKKVEQNPVAVQQYSLISHPQIVPNEEVPVVVEPEASYFPVYPSFDEMFQEFVSTQTEQPTNETVEYIDPTLLVLQQNSVNTNLNQNFIAEKQNNQIDQTRTDVDKILAEIDEQLAQMSEQANGVSGLIPAGYKTSNNQNDLNMFEESFLDLSDVNGYFNGIPDINNEVDSFNDVNDPFGFFNMDQ